MGKSSPDQLENRPGSHLVKSSALRLRPHPEVPHDLVITMEAKKLRDLPEPMREKIQSGIGDKWEEVEGLTWPEFQCWMERDLEESATRLEIAQAKADRRRRHYVVFRELYDMVKPLAKKHDLPLWQFNYFLRGEQKHRFQELMRELEELNAIEKLEWEMDQALDAKPSR